MFRCCEEYCTELCKSLQHRINSSKKKIIDYLFDKFCNIKTNKQHLDYQHFFICNVSKETL